MNEMYVKAMMYEITVSYKETDTDEYLPNDTYYKPTRAEAEALKEELLATDDEIDEVYISDDPVEREVFNHDYKTDSAD